MNTPEVRRLPIREVALINERSITSKNAPSQIEYIDISSVGTGEFTAPPALMSFEDAPSRARRIVRAGDTILSTVRPNRRSFLFLSSPSTIAVASTGFAVLTPTQAVDDRFLYYWVTRQDFTDYLSLHAKGAAYPAVSAEDIGNAEIELPPLPIQRRIAGILSAYDELIENSQRRIKILEAMARALYREWFVHFRFPGHESVPRVPSPLGEIPQGWEVKPFTDAADVLSGGTPKTDVADYWDGDIPFFTPRDAPGCFYVNDCEKHVTDLGLSKCASSLYPPDTVFITARGTVGKVALPSVPMAMNQSCYALQGKLGISQRYLFLLTLQQVDYLKTNTGGATFDTIVVDTFRRMQIVIPPRVVIADFAKEVDAMFEEVNTLQRQIQTLRRTRDLLLPRLLSGQIDEEAIPT
jgi:type I restriction enzyme S subunit